VIVRPARPAAALAAIVLLTCGIARAGTPIGPDQHFTGRVNGHHAGAIVRVVCPGPSTVGRTGAVLSGQTFSVSHSPAGTGYTGLFSQVYAWFTANAGVNGPLAARLTRYGTDVAIPAGVQVPCDGTGQVEFSSCPYLAPCAYGWVPTFVTVRFANVAA
jgi:hypothetical protein